MSQIKELFSIFGSPILYAALFIFFAVLGYFFYSDTVYFSILSFRGTTDPFLSEKLNLTAMVVTPFFGDLSVILLLMLPLLTMRLYAEEKKSGTIELLFTYPLSDQAVLARQNQLDVANQLMASEQYPQAAGAYERFLKHYQNYEHAADIYLMLGLIYGRYLKQYDRANPMLEQAMQSLKDERKRELARIELENVRRRRGGG